MYEVLNEDDEYRREIVGTDLKTSQVNLFNLKSSLSRSVTEAASASLLKSYNVENFGPLEDTMC